MAVLVDTSMLLAFAFARDANHEAASRTLHALSQETGIVPAPVLTELFYMTMVRINYARAIQIFASTRTAFEIQTLAVTDMIRMQQIMEQYLDATFDFTDTAIMALSERLDITRIATFDRRDSPSSARNTVIILNCCPKHRFHRRQPSQVDPYPGASHHSL